MFYEFLQKNWLIILISIGLALALTSSGILGFQASSTRRHFVEARERIVELEGTIDRAGDRIGELESGLVSLGSDYRKLESSNKLLKEQYQNLRGHYLKLESGNRNLTESNNRSLGLVREGLSILREIRENN